LELGDYPGEQIAQRGQQRDLEGVGGPFQSMLGPGRSDVSRIDGASQGAQKRQVVDREVLVDLRRGLVDQGED